MIGGYWQRRTVRRAFRKASAARDARDWRTAARHYRRFLAARPGDFAIWVQLGHMLAEAGDLGEADAAYRRAAEIDPQDADLALCRGHLERRRSNIEGALDFYRKSFELDGNDHAARALAELAPPPEEPETEPEPEVGPEPEQSDADGDSTTIDCAADEMLHSEEESAALQEEGAEPEAPPAWGGRIEGWYLRGVSGVLFETEDEQPWVEFREGQRLVGQATPSRRDDGMLEFRTVLDVELGDNGEGAEVLARRMPDGATLEPGPIILFPPSRHPEDHAVAWSLPSVTVKPFVGDPRGEVALFVTHSRSGKVKPHVLPYIRALKAAGLSVCLIASVDRPLDPAPELLDLVDGMLVRRNGGYDFAAWAHALKLDPRLYGSSTLYLVNDSVLPAADTGRIATLVEQVRASEADLVGLTESHEWRWHVQSYFLAVKSRFLSSRAFHGFMDDVRLLTRKDHVIRAYEVRLAELAEESGHRVDILYPSATAINPTLFGWRALIEAGMPFVKLLLLRGQFDAIDIDGWQDVLAAHGFDAALAEAVIAAAAEEGSVDDGGRLLARRLPERAAGADERLKVAFFGPWNYDNGLGSASRGIIAALRETGVRLNLHPVHKAFHVHKPLTPPVDIVDFAGPADIAIVHLNPDSWHLLTDDQLAAIGAARKRIGYWVWEMGHIPPAWRRNFGAVDRIWAPSRYCADVFAAGGDVPVDVVPHVVPLAETSLVDPGASRERLGLPADRRTILYIFDGSSYLVRKNPAALVRAFAASGLAERGWSLVLKTKHLLDRPEEGEALTALADATDGVVLMDRSMTADELADLVAAADIYASPHCSEGFGLTVAEAMAMGKPVVATDFGGTRDFLDAESGWPVRAHGWTLDQDFGHYTVGGSWARIDEPALSLALTQAAEAVEASDSSKGDAARARIAGQLSQAAVAERIRDSFARLRTEPAEGRGLTFAVNGRAGMPAERVAFGEGLHMLLLAPDGAYDAAVPPELPDDPDAWVVLAPRDSRLAPMFERAWRDAMQARPDAGIFYGDDIAAEATRPIDQLRLKPCFDVTLLAAQDYIGAPLIVRASVLREIGLDPTMGSALLDDLLMRAHHAGVSIARIAQVLLCHPGERPQSDPVVRRRMLERLPRYRDHIFVAGRAPDTLLQRRRFGKVFPDVSLVIPTRRSRVPDSRTTYVERLLKAVAKVDWPMDRLTVIVGDDIAGEPAWAKRDWPFALRRIETLRAVDEPFNYAAKMNRLWREATSGQIVLMNDDLLPVEGGWLRALIGFSMDEDVGGVGGRLLYADGRMQHAGIAPLFGAVAHPWAGRSTDRATYQDWASVQREWSAVTGALFATRRSLLERIGGFDEQFTLEFNDIDMCLRMRALGLRIICTPDAEMVHAEKASRGEMPAGGDQYASFMQRWKPWLAQDPSWHPGLRWDSFEVMPVDDRDAWYR
ncbi:MAG: glycosyltransferase [Pseudomonadota bacterium]